MGNRAEKIQVKIINQIDFKETHGLFIGGKLHHTGTENECTFLKLKILDESKEKQGEKNDKSLS